MLSSPPEYPAQRAVYLLSKTTASKVIWQTALTLFLVRKLDGLSLAWWDAVQAGVCGLVKSRVESVV